MHVGLNLIFLVPGATGGMEIAARALIAELEALGVRLTAFVGRDVPPGDLGVETVVLPIRASSRVQWVAGEQALLPRAGARADIDLLHSMGNTAPAAGRFARVVTIHDLHHLVAPEAHELVHRLGMKALVPLAARRSHRIVTVSEASRDDIVEHLGIDPGRIDVVPNGLGRPPQPELAPAAADLRARLGLDGRRVLLCMSAKRRHKNLAGLLEALARIPAERRPLAVLPGYATAHEAELEALAARLGVAADVRLLGWVGDADAEGLYALADLFVFPSRYEGFGLPILEAMARGVPVATSDRSSMPEVAGDAALLFDPDRPEQIAAAIERILGDSALAERLAAAGRERAQRFSWRAAAELLVASYERTLAAR